VISATFDHSKTRFEGNSSEALPLLSQLMKLLTSNEVHLFEFKPSQARVTPITAASQPLNPMRETGVLCGLRRSRFSQSRTSGQREWNLDYV